MVDRWLELRVVKMRHSVSKAMWDEAYCEVGRGGVPAKGYAGRRIEVEEKEIGVCVEFCD